MNSLRVPGHELIQRIGSGGMAQVWMARRRGREGMSKVVALKFPTSDHEETLRLFAREARLSALLSHSNIVQVFDVGETDEGRPYLVMEWVDGLNLAQLISGWRRAKVSVPVGVCTFVAAELLKALDYAHHLRNESGPLQIVHRDISPQNVLVSISGEVKLTDFGIARASLEETAGIVVRGKLRYMPAEQLLGRRVDNTADLYAVGAILWELLAGRPFRGEAGEEALYSAALNGEIPKLDRLDVPMVLEALLEGLLAHDPSRRIGNAKEALALLYKAPQDPAAAQVLEAACRSLIGVQGPRSGIVDAVPDAAMGQATPGGRSASASGGAAAALGARAASVSTPSPQAAASSSQDGRLLVVPGTRPGPAIGGEDVVADATQTLAAPMSEAQTLVQTPPQRERPGTPGDAVAAHHPHDAWADAAAIAADMDGDGAIGATVTRLRPPSASQSAATLASASASASTRAHEPAASRSSGVFRAESSDGYRIAPAPSRDATDGGSRASGPGWLMPALFGGVGVAILVLAWNLVLASAVGQGEPTQAGSREGESGAPRTGDGETSARDDDRIAAASGTPQADRASPGTRAEGTTDLAPTATEQLGPGDANRAGALEDVPINKPASPPLGEVGTPTSVLADGVATDASPSTLEDATGAASSETSASSTTSPASKVSATKVEVTLSNGDFKTAYIRIGKREYVLEPRLATQLSTGKHKFSIRADPESPWAAAGTVELEKGKKYKLIMRDGPPHVDVVEL